MAERTYTIGQTTSQAQDRQARDLDFEAGRFFWVVDPDSVPGAPAVDILELDPRRSRPPTARPSALYRYRAASGSRWRQSNLGGITASARRGDGQEPLAPVRWELLIQGTDYYLDDSGLWVVLATKLDQNDYLATSFGPRREPRSAPFPRWTRAPAPTTSSSSSPSRSRTRPAAPSGTRCGTCTRRRRRPRRHLAGSRHHPQPLRAAGHGLGLTYLQQLGLAEPNDPVVFDRENRLWPRARDPEATNVVNDRFIVFPHLEPFADPSKLSPRRSRTRSTRCGVPAADRGATAKFALRLRYNASGMEATAPTSTSTPSRSATGASSLRRRPEAGPRRGLPHLVRRRPGHLRQPDSSSGGGAPRCRRASRRGIFAVAPTTILGMSTRYALGDRRTINLIGLYQREQSAFNRPALGFEATANLIGGQHPEHSSVPRGSPEFLNSPHLHPDDRAFRPGRQCRDRLQQAGPEPLGRGACLEGSSRRRDCRFPCARRSGSSAARRKEAVGLEDIGFSAFDPPTRSSWSGRAWLPISPSILDRSRSGRRISTRSSSWPGGQPRMCST